MQQAGGVDAVFDPLGYESFDQSYSILKRGGILVGLWHEPASPEEDSSPRRAAVHLQTSSEESCFSGGANGLPSTASRAPRSTTSRTWSCSSVGFSPERSPSLSKPSSPSTTSSRRTANMPAVKAAAPSSSRSTHSRHATPTACMAEGEGFEPPLPVKVKRFSRPPVSATHTSLRSSNDACGPLPKE